MNIRSWLRAKLWPWKEIDRLREALKSADNELRWRRQAGSIHQASWLANANMMWGPNPFNANELTMMCRIYQDGFTFREAVDHLKIYTGRVRI